VVLGRYAQRKLLEYQDREAAEYLTEFRSLLVMPWSLQSLCSKHCPYFVSDHIQHYYLHQGKITKGDIIQQHIDTQSV